MSKKLSLFKDPNTTALYERIPKKGIRLANQFMTAPSNGYLTVHDGDVITFYTPSCFLGDEGKPEREYNTYDLGRVFGVVVRNADGNAPDAPSFAIIQLSSDMGFGFLRFIPQAHVTAVQDYRQPFFRWFATGPCGFEEANQIIRLSNYGSLNNNYMSLRSEDARLTPPREAQCHPSLVLPHTHVAQAAHDFEQWLISYGAFVARPLTVYQLDHGELPWVVNKDVSYALLVDMFLKKYLHYSHESRRVYDHAKRLEEEKRK